MQFTRVDVRGCVLAFALCAAAFACDGSPTSPSAPRIAIEPPVLQGIYLGGSLEPGGTIFFSALAADENFRMPEGGYYPMVVWSNKGENETVDAQSLACFDNLRRMHVCGSFQVRIDSAADPIPVLVAANAADARLIRSDWWPDSATFYAFGDLRSAMQSVRRRVGVTYVGLWYVDSIGISPETVQRYAESALRFENGTPIPNDGRFTASPGDSVFARVAQPGGGSHLAAFVLW